MNRNVALFLDRDGVINVDHGYVSTAERTEFINGIFSLVRTTNRLGYRVVIVTNQAGIARGFYTEQQFHEYMAWVRAQFARHGGKIDAIFHCPHHPTEGIGGYLTECICRKPAPGMILEAQRVLDLDLSQSILLGDKDSDVQAGIRAGVGTNILLGSEKFPDLRHVQDFISELEKPTPQGGKR
jgi:D-glycero-D-manno-heptose 1,7-bisphosphate phosphatase